jgi:hypothetical protein
MSRRKADGDPMVFLSKVWHYLPAMKGEEADRLMLLYKSTCVSVAPANVMDDSGMVAVSAAYGSQIAACV